MDRDEAVSNMLTSLQSGGFVLKLITDIYNELDLTLEMFTLLKLKYLKYSFKSFYFVLCVHVVVFSIKGIVRVFLSGPVCSSELL